MFEDERIRRKMRSGEVTWIAASLDSMSLLRSKREISRGYSREILSRSCSVPSRSFALSRMPGSSEGCIIYRELTQYPHMTVRDSRDLPLVRKTTRENRRSDLLLNNDIDIVTTFVPTSARHNLKLSHSLSFTECILIIHVFYEARADSQISPSSSSLFFF